MAEAPQQHKPVFLIVDDDPMVRRVVAKGLEALEPEVVLEVEDGLQAQQVLEERAVDVVVTDVLMPNMDGRELMKWAQEHCPEPIWIVLSGLDTFDAAVDALHLGAFDFLSKPPELHRVRVAVRNALDQLALHRDRQRLYGELAESHDRLAEKVQQLEDLCHILEDQAEVIQADLARAEIIQRALLPQVPPKIGRWCVETLYRPGSNVGGDYYDVISLDDRHLGIVLADAAGHGVAAAMLAVLFKHRLQLSDPESGEPLAPAEVLRRLNQQLFDDMNAPGMFITAVYALLDRRTGKMKVASAGHPPLVAVGGARGPRQLKRTGPALGLEYGAEYGEDWIVLDAGDRVLLYTDGVVEGGETAPGVDDLAELISDTQTARGRILMDIYTRATAGVEQDRDDITMVLLERNDGESRFDSWGEPTEDPERALPTGTQVQLLQGANGRGFMSIAGNGTWMRSGAFFDVATALLQRHGGLTIDLGACDYLDSTFLGTIYEIAMSNPAAVRLQRVPAKIRALFEELDMTGVLSLISMLAEDLPDEMAPLSSAGQEESEQGRRVLKAHEILASLSDENQERFRGVVESLRADLDRVGRTPH